VRVPLVNSPKARRIEVRFPDPTCNPYLAFTAMMMAGLDGVQNKIHPGDPIDKTCTTWLPKKPRTFHIRVLHSTRRFLIWTRIADS